MNRINTADEPQSGVPAVRLFETIFYRLRGFLGWFQIPMLLLFLAIIFIPLALPDPTEQAGALDHFTRLARFLIWGLWFPILFLSVLVAGRSWCGLLCPMGAASEWLNKRGLQRQTPGWIRWDGNPILSFILITILGQTLGVREHPEAMAEIFGGTLILACCVGLIYGRGKRVWCRYLCPIGMLLGVFSRLGILDFGNHRNTIVQERTTEKGVCPTMIDLRCKRASRHCIACHRCINPHSRGGLNVKLRTPGTEIAKIHAHQPRASELAFLFLGTGLMLGGFLWLVDSGYQRVRSAVGEWFIDNGQYWIGQSGPGWLMSVHPERREVFNWLDFITITGYMVGWMLLAATFLTTLTLMASWAARSNKNSKTLTQRFLVLGYQYMPIALVSLIVGLGGDLFNLLQPLGFDNGAIESAKTLLILGAMFWSLLLGYQMLTQLELNRRSRLFAFVPGAVGSVTLGALWIAAILGWPHVIS